jgi:hypothetical protein
VEGGSPAAVAVIRAYERTGGRPVATAGGLVAALEGTLSPSGRGRGAGAATTSWWTSISRRRPRLRPLTADRRYAVWTVAGLPVRDVGGLAPRHRAPIDGAPAIWSKARTGTVATIQTGVARRMADGVGSPSLPPGGLACSGPLGPPGVWSRVRQNELELVPKIAPASRKTGACPRRGPTDAPGRDSRPLPV